jgi:hypothetical protein
MRVGRGRGDDGSAGPTSPQSTRVYDASVCKVEAGRRPGIPGDKGVGEVRAPRDLSNKLLDAGSCWGPHERDAHSAAAAIASAPS